MKPPKIFKPIGESAEMEQENVEDAGEQEAYSEELTTQSTNAKKSGSPYGPQFPGLERYFKAGR